MEDVGPYDGPSRVGHHREALALLRAELLAMAAEDQQVRAQLLAAGVLFDGYHPRMAEVHHRHATRLAAIMDQVGWPSRRHVGEAASNAAWLVLQHSIGDPAVMRRGLALLQALQALQATAPEDVEPAQVAMLEDRVRLMSGRPQRYGTQFDWDEHGAMSPQAIEDPGGVDARRRAVGLPPLVERIRQMRADLARAGARPPEDAAARRREIDDWERRVGWRA